MKLQLTLAKTFIPIIQETKVLAWARLELSPIEYNGNLEALLNTPEVLTDIEQRLSTYAVQLDGLSVEDGTVYLDVTYLTQQESEIPDSLILATVETDVDDILSEEDCYELYKSLYPQVTNVLSKGTKIMLPTSYSDCCAEDKPCGECLKMCNTFMLSEDTKVMYTGELQNGGG